MVTQIGERYVKACLRWFRRGSSRRRRVLALFVGAAVFAVIIPSTLILAGRHLDRALGLEGLLPHPWSFIVGLIVAGAGWPLALWAVYVQYTVGKGTPLPNVPTARLITGRPYHYCRNPMAFGTMFLYVGFALIFGTVSTLFLIFLLFTPMLVFVKVYEEKELEARFGEEYLKYKERTPFLIPRFWRRSRGDME